MSNKRDERLNSFFYALSTIPELESAIELLCTEHGHCTPTEVLRLARAKSTPHMLRLVIEIAERNGYRIQNSGRGVSIRDW